MMLGLVGMRSVESWCTTFTEFLALGKPERFNVFARVPPMKFPGGALLRKPLVTAALTWFKIMDAF